MYQPSQQEFVEEADEDAEEDYEIAALAWGLVSAGGLGIGSASVLGAEIVSR